MDFTYEKLAEAIKEKMGIDFKKKLEYLKRKIEPIIREENITIAEIMSKMNKEPQYLQRIIELVTINETYFFREQEQLEAFKDALIELKKQKRSIRIWSSACSSGEEPYTLAFIAKDIVGEDVEIEIVATDINMDVLDIARKGEYSKSSLSFRRMDKRYIEKYFEEEEHHYKVKQEYKKMIRFTNFNLVDRDKWIMMKNFDIIFCRNVLIYFDDKTIKEINKNFYNSLCEKGYLFLGHSDPHREIHSEFHMISTKDSTYLKKGE